MEKIEGKWKLWAEVIFVQLQFKIYLLKYYFSGIHIFYFILLPSTVSDNHWLADNAWDCSTNIKTKKTIIISSMFLLDEELSTVINFLLIFLSY